MATPQSKPNEIRIIRVYDAPVAAVWDAWTDPSQVAKWWGPRGFTITTHSHDLRTGGSWQYTMHGPDGKDWPNTTQYFEVQKHAKLHYDHGGNETTPPLFRVTVLFSESDGKTTMDMTMALATAEAAENTKKFIRAAGGNTTWDRLAEYLAKEKNGEEKFFIARSFDVPLETMFQLWTAPEHMQKWTPPTGFEMQFIRADIRPGGSNFYSMTGHGTTMYGRAHYLEIRKPDLIVYKQQFCDANEKVSRHPMAKHWPETMLTTIQLTAEGPDQTRVTIIWQPVGNVTREEFQAFIDMKSGMTMGWTGSLDKLEAYLAE